MSEKSDEWLSFLVDGEVAGQSRHKLLADLSRDPVLLERWTRYHLIRDTLRNAIPDWVACDLSNRIGRALADEPTVLAPRSRTWVWARGAAGIGVAATIAAVAIIAVPTDRSAGEDPIVAASATSQPAPVVAPHTVAAPLVNWEQQPQSFSVDYRLSGYLVNHNEYSAISGMQGALPYMRIVGAPATRQVPDETR